MVEKIFMSQKPIHNVEEKALKVRRGRVDSVDLYEIKENELEILANGEPTTIYLNFSIFLLSMAITAVTSLCTASFNNNIIKYSFLFTAILCFIIGIFLLILWYIGKKSIKAIIQKIKERIPPEYDYNEEENPSDTQINLSLIPSPPKKKNNAT
jgi:hypothetical protein